MAYGTGFTEFHTFCRPGSGKPPLSPDPGLTSLQWSTIPRVTTRARIRCSNSRQRLSWRSKEVVGGIAIEHGHVVKTWYCGKKTSEDTIMSA